MIKTTITMLSKAWAICSAFKPEEALHNDRLNKTIEREQSRPNFVLVDADTFGELPTRMLRSMHVEDIFADRTKSLFIEKLEADKETGFSNEGGAK